MQKICRCIVLLFALTSSARSFLYGQPKPLRLSLRDALGLVREKNKLVGVSRLDQTAVEEDLKDSRNATLPRVGFVSNYQRFSRLTLFRNGLTGDYSSLRDPEPTSADFGVDASYTLFAGGRLRSAIEEQVIRRDIASLNTLDQTGNASLQVVAGYLDILRLDEQDSLIADQIKRAETRLKNIRALYENQKVTRSDVLRAEVILSNEKLSREATENDIGIATDHLGVLLALPAGTRITLTDSAGDNEPEPASLQALVAGAAIHSYAIIRIQDLIKLQDNGLRSIKSGYYPTVQFFSAYGLNYPNFLVYPYVDQFYMLGFVGLRLQYDISSLYENRHKESAARIRQTSLQLQQSAITDAVNQEARALAIKYGEALDRIRVAQASIEQTRVNYKIVTSKYFNQLALLTDLLDADNLFLESRLDLIRSQTDALVFYYRLLYISGNL
jgi:outer membrane protein